MTAVRTQTIFHLYGFCMGMDSAFMSTPPTAFIEQFDTLPLHCRHIEHTRGGVWLGKNNF